MNNYKVIGRFYSNGVRMIAVLMNKAACTMPEREFNRIIEAERKWDREYKIA
jgi:hypothetical protein